MSANYSEIKTLLEEIILEVPGIAGFAKDRERSIHILQEHNVFHVSVEINCLLTTNIWSVASEVQRRTNYGVEKILKNDPKIEVYVTVEDLI